MRPDSITAYETTARFEPAPGGPRFVLTYRPAQGYRRGTIVLAPPFAEEMNKSRRMLAQAARELAADGWQVVQADLYGCGDSAGDFGDAAWEQWIADLRRLVDEQRKTDGELWLWGLRAGALLLPPLLASNPTPNLLLWQPMTDGAQALNEFLRLRTSADRLEGRQGMDRKGLRNQLLRGEAVEVAGYILAPRVANDLAIAHLELPLQYAGRVVWLDVVSTTGDSTSTSTRKALTSWRAAGHDVEFESVVGPQFWQTVEIAEVPALIERTRCALDRSRAPASAVALAVTP